MDWIAKVRDGDFDAIPWLVSFEEASELALLIEGCEVAGSVQRCMAISNRVAGDIRRIGRTPASALDLWIALFGQQRAHCHAGFPPTDDEAHLFGELVRLLRLTLKDLSPKQKAGIMSIIRREEALS
jgi:hypothetical protein